jgi:flagellar basal-body rod protein FlgB
VNINFGSTVDMLKNAMQGAGKTHSVIANNIANVNTPNFKRSDVSFKEALARTQPSTGDSDELAMVTDDPAQMTADGSQDVQPFSVTQTVDDTEQMRTDGSNVDVDQEMAKLSINSGYSQQMAGLLTQQYTRLRQAIQEQF